MIRYRPHCGSLAESLSHAREVDGLDGLIAHLRWELQSFPSASSFTDDQVRVQPYYGNDDRIGWLNVHIVTIDGYGVMGFCEGPAE